MSHETYGSSGGVFLSAYSIPKGSVTERFGIPLYAEYRLQLIQSDHMR